MSSNGDISIGATVGLIHVAVALAPLKIGQATVNFAESAVNFIKESVKNMTPKQWSGSKKVTGN